MSVQNDIIGKMDFKLSLSIITKSHLLAVGMNNVLKSEYNFNRPDDISQWPYYLNLAGLPHQFNSKILFKHSVTNQEVELTKTLVENDLQLKAELRRLDKLYLSLLTKYPNDGLYIRGMIYPIDTAISTTAKEGEILSFDKSYVEWNETNLIIDLQRNIYNWLERWVNYKYLSTDLYYAHATILSLNNFILNKISEIRILNVNTFQATEFYVNSKLNSYFGIGNKINFLPKEFRLWLYKNIDYISTNIGKENTLNTLLEKLEEYGYHHQDLTLNATLPTLNGNGTVDIEDTGLRFQKRIDVESLLELEKDKVPEKYREITLLNRNYIELIKHTLQSNSISEPTKDILIYVDKNDLILSAIPREHIILDSVFYILSKYTTFVEVTVNNAPKYYDKNIVICIILYILLGDIKIDNIELSYLFKHVPIATALDKIQLPADIGNPTIYDGVINDINNLDLNVDLTTSDTRGKFYTELSNTHDRFYATLTNLESAIVKTNLKLIKDRMTDRIKIPIDTNGQSLKVFLDANSVDTNTLNNLDALDKLVLDIINIPLIKRDNEELDNVITLMSSLSSYTVQFLKQTTKTSNLVNRESITSVEDINFIEIKELLYDCLGDKVNIISNFIGDDKMDTRLVALPGIRISESGKDTRPEIHYRLLNSDVYRETNGVKISIV